MMVRKRSAMVLCVLIGPLFGFLSLHIPHHPVLTWNSSASMPRGLYLIRQLTPRKGDRVLVKLPGRPEQLAHIRKYLPDHIPVLKSVVGLSGDRVCRQGSEIIINGKPVAMALIHDRQGRPMPVWSECRVLQPGEMFLLSPHPASFDSRYFGAVSRSQMIGVARPLWLLSD